MIIIKEKPHKLTIKCFPLLDWRVSIGIVLWIVLFSGILHAGLNLFQLAGFVFINIIGLGLFFHKGENVTWLEADFENLIIRYKTEKVKTIRQLDIKNGFKILTSQHRGFAFSLQTSDTLLPLYELLEHNSAFKLSRLFYGLNRQGNFLLDECGKYLAENPVRYSLFWIGAWSYLLWIGIATSSITDTPLSTTMKELRPLISQGTAALIAFLFVLLPPVPVIYGYYKFSHWRGRYLTRDEVSDNIESLPKESFFRNKFIIERERRINRWPFDEQSELLTYLVELPGNRPIWLKKNFWNVLLIKIE